MSEALRESLVAEADKKIIDALYTSVGLFEWHKRLRTYKNIFLFAEMGFAAICVWGLQSGHTIVGSVFGLVAGIGPSTIDAFKLDELIAQTKASANEFRSLRDKYRRVSDIHSNRSVPSLERRFLEVSSEYDAASKISPPLPDKFFQKAKEKIEAGQYSHP